MVIFLFQAMPELVSYPVPLLACTLSLVLLSIPVPVACFNPVQALPIILLSSSLSSQQPPSHTIRQTQARSENKTAATSKQTTAAAYNQLAA